MTDTTIISGAHIGNWTVLNVDTTGKRAACACICSKVQEVAVSALADGTSRSCGCAPLTAPQREALRNEIERWQRRRELKNWRPGDRSA